MTIKKNCNFLKNKFTLVFKTSISALREHEYVDKFNKFSQVMKKLIWSQSTEKLSSVKVII